MKKSSALILTISLIFSVTGCGYAHADNADSGAGESTAVLYEESTAITEESTPAADSMPVESTAASPAATVPPETAPPQSSETEDIYSETECDEYMYVNIACWSLYEADENAMWSDYYWMNQKVHICAKTSNGYCRLDDGCYLHSSLLGDEPYGALPLPQDPPEDFKTKTSYYDPRKALKYASENWWYGASMCAEFGSQCLKAGGVPQFYTTSATHLMNDLISSDLGFAVEIPRNEDGSVTLPDYAFPGDIVFYYCKTENLAMHTTIYNGDDKNGHMKVYAHNDAADGQEPIYFYKHCVQGCKGTIDSVVMFCFYRNPEILKQPDSPPTLNITLDENGALFGWEPDFLYGEATLVVKDSSGKEIFHKSMGTESSHYLPLDKGEYKAYVIFELGNDNTAQTALTTFSL